jgi:hypothetical protein
MPLPSRAAGVAAGLAVAAALYGIYWRRRRRRMVMPVTLQSNDGAPITIRLALLDDLEVLRSDIADHRS